MELGIISLSDIQTDPATGRPFPYGQRLDEIAGYATLADRRGLDVFALGEHHSLDFAVSSPAVVLAAIASRTSRIRLTSGVTVLAPGGSGEDAAELEFGEVRAGAQGALVFQFTPYAFAGAVGQRGADVSDRVPGRLVELDRAGDGVTQKQGALLPGGEHDAQMARGMSRRQERGNPGCDGGVPVDGLQAAGDGRRPRPRPAEKVRRPGGLAVLPYDHDRAVRVVKFAACVIARQRWRDAVQRGCLMSMTGA